MADLEAAKAVLDKHLRAEEGERLKPYLCDAGIPTIGVGATTYLDGRKVSLSDPPITVEQMDRMLSVDIDRYMNATMKAVDGEATTNQLVGLTLCEYNIGIPGLAGSSMVKAHKAKNYAAAARAFTLWNKYRKTKGGPLIDHPALTARRLREAAIYLTPDEGSITMPIPQAIEPETGISKSPIVKGGVAATGTGVIGVLAAAGESIATLKEPLGKAKDFLAEVVGIPPSWLPYLVLIAVGIAVIYWRKKQRTEGWA